MTAAREPPPSFLGTGWVFPPTFHAGGAEVAVVSGAENVHQALAILLRTRPGERPLRETFGCDLDAALFEEVDQALVNRLTGAIGEAVLRHEPRVIVRAVHVTQGAEPGVLQIRLEYTIPATNSRYNMVFPFYLHEASATAR